MKRSIRLCYGFLFSCLFVVLLLQITIWTQITCAALTLPNHAPTDFIKVRPDIPKGKLETITYNSKSIGVEQSLPQGWFRVRL